MGYVYLLHFDEPLKHARHYIGYAEQDVEKRLATHRKSQGASLTAALNRAGIPYRIVRTWSEVDRHFERALKKRHEAAVLCPICRKAHLKKKLEQLRHRRRKAAARGTA